MLKKYTDKELQELYKELSEELKEAIFSEKTAEYIRNICNRNNIKQISNLAEKIGNVLVGVLPMNEFQEVIEKELEINKEIAKQVTREVNRFIFYPVRIHLEKLYQTEITPFSTSSSTTQVKIESNEFLKKKEENNKELEKEKEEKMDK